MSGVLVGAACIKGRVHLLRGVSASPTLLWFRQDLRLQDNPALNAAVARGGPVLPVYVLDDAAEGRWAAGGASRWWLHHSLHSLDASLREKGSRLILARGSAAEIIPALQQATGAGAVYWNRRYEPAAIARDSALKAALIAAGTEAKSWNSALLFEPHEVRNREGGPFKVFTPFWRHCLTLNVTEPVRAPAGMIPALSPGAAASRAARGCAGRGIRAARSPRGSRAPVSRRKGREAGTGGRSANGPVPATSGCWS